MSLEPKQSDTDGICRENDDGQKGRVRPSNQTQGLSARWRKLGAQVMDDDASVLTSLISLVLKTSRKQIAAYVSVRISGGSSITSKRIRRGNYTSVDDLETAIYDYLLQHNAKPKPFTWTKTVGNIPTRERRARNKLDEFRGNK